MIKTFECPECGTGMKVEIAGIEGGILRWRREQPKPNLEDRPAWRTGIFVDGRQVYPPRKWLELETKAVKDVGCKVDCENCDGTCVRPTATNEPVNHP